MSISIFNRIRESEQQDSQQSQRAYWALLAKIDIENAGTEDADKLRSAMQSAGKTVAAMEADYQRVQQAKQHLQKLADNADIAQQIDKAQAAHEAACLERQQLWKAINEKVTAANSHLETCRAIQDQRTAARRAIDDLGQQSPLMLEALTAKGKRK